MEELIPIVLFVCVAAVAILRPITTRFGALLEAMARQRTVEPANDAELERLRLVLDHTARRLDLIEERLDFTERLVTGSRMTRQNAPTLPGTDRTLL
jgi:hypothetical protein